MKALPYLVVYTIPVAVLVSLFLGGWAYLATPVLIFVAIPVLDELLGKDDYNPTPAEEQERKDNIVYDLIVRLWVPVQLVLMAMIFGIVASGSLAVTEIIGLVVSTSLLTVAGINVAHELMHRKSKSDRALAEVLMNSVSYTHFCIEHVHGHHRNIATPNDPASSSLGQSLYSFFPQVIWGSLKSVIHIEGTRNERRCIPWYSPYNRLTRDAVVGIATHLAVFAIGGWQVELFFIAQSIGAIALLEVINYIEHYGLQRPETAPGKYGPVMEWHSWNANHRMSNLWMFNLQRHADHHAHTSRPYYLLRAVIDGPQLPYGYPSMVLIAFVPPLWRKVMDHRVQELTTQVAVEHAMASK